MPTSIRLVMLLTYLSANAGVSGYVKLTKGTRMSLSCKDDSDSLAQGLQTVFPNSSVRVNEINVLSCPPPTTSYANVLQELNVDIATIEKFTVNNIRNLTALRPTHLAGLSITELAIDNSEELELTRLDHDLFEPIISLEKLTVQRVQLPPLAKSSRLVDVSLLEGASMGAFGGCAELQELSLVQWKLSKLKGGWLEHCPKLNKLMLSLVTEQTLQFALVGMRTIKSLSIKKCVINFISDKLLADATELRELRISEHMLYSIHWAAFKSQLLLEELYLGSNSLTYNGYLMQALQSIRSLRILSLEYNSKIDFCKMFQSNNTSSLLLLERLDLRGTGLTQLCFKNMDNLAYLNLSDTNIRKLEFQQLPSPIGHSLVVDLSGNPIDDLSHTETDYHMMINKFNKVHNVTVKLELYLNCDCQQAWFARALRDVSKLSVAGARCLGSGERLDRVPPERLDCDKYPCERCQCRRAWRDNATEVDCHGANLCTMPHLSHVPNIRKFIAPRNVIKPLRAEDFVETLMVVDLRFNHVSYVEEDAVTALFSTPGRNVSLSGNPLVCDCDNQLLIAALQSHRSQVPDFENVTCVGDGKSEEVQMVSEVMVSELCAASRQRSLLVLAAAGGVLLALAAIAGALYRCYGRELRIYLYARGWCLCCVREETLDDERPYDAFVSFSHEDDEFVAREMLPALESQFRLCLHTRNWVPGEMIATQIVRSVEQSRRTIIVLSKNFACSMWGMMEFRTAYVGALREGRVRVIVVVLDDVLQQEGLDSELRRYLRTNTYLRWGDPGFWERLRYALPRRRTPMKNLMKAACPPLAQSTFT